MSERLREQNTTVIKALSTDVPRATPTIAQATGLSSAVVLRTLRRLGRLGMVRGREYKALVPVRTGRLAGHAKRMLRVYTWRLLAPWETERLELAGSMRETLATTRDPRLKAAIEACLQEIENHASQ